MPREKKREFHNLDGLARDLRAALAAGEQRIYEFAELMLDVLDLIELSPEDNSGAEELPGGVDSREDSLLDADGGERADAQTAQSGRSNEAVQPTLPGLVRVPVGEGDRMRLPLADASGTGGGRPDGRAALLTDEELTQELARRGRTPNGKQKFGVTRA